MRNSNYFHSVAPAVRKVIELVEANTDDSYIVGGFIRDYFLGKSNFADMDIAVHGNGFEIARNICSQLGAGFSFAPLDEEYGCGRIIINDSPFGVVDISSFKAKTIHEDLMRRDFTVNAIAVSLSSFALTGLRQIYDPLDGLADITGRVIRACSENSIQDDPLRILRAYRFAGHLGFSMDQGLLSLIKGSMGELKRVAGERIRDELFLILSQPNASEVLKKMEDILLVSALFPEVEAMKGCQQNRYHRLDVWDHSLECVRQLENLTVFKEDIAERCFGDHSDTIRDYLDFEVCPGRNRYWLIKLACLFHDSGKPAVRTRDAKGIVHFYSHEKWSGLIFDHHAEKLRLSKKEHELVSLLIRGHMRMGSLTTTEPSKRFKFRLLDRFQDDVIALSLVFIADLRASDGPARNQRHLQMALDGVKRILESRFALEQNPVQPYLDGYDLMSIFKISQGRLIGYILRTLKEKQALGIINSRQEALEAVQGILEVAIRKFG